MYDCGGHKSSTPSPQAMVSSQPQTATALSPSDASGEWNLHMGKAVDRIKITETSGVIKGTITKDPAWGGMTHSLNGMRVDQEVELFYSAQTTDEAPDFKTLESYSFKGRIQGNHMSGKCKVSVTALFNTGEAIPNSVDTLWNAERIPGSISVGNIRATQSIPIPERQQMSNLDSERLQTNENLNEIINRGVQLANSGRNAEAYSLFKHAADKGSALGQYNLGACYIDGEGIEQDSSKAVYWYTLAANKGLAVAQTKLGLCYYRGIGVERNPLWALSLFKQAADQGWKDGITCYNQLYKELQAKDDERAQLRQDLRDRGLNPDDLDGNMKILKRRVEGAGLRWNGN